MADFQIPSNLEKRLFVSNKKLAKKLVAKLDDFADLLVGDKLEFFVEYTDHSIEHVNKVLENIEDLMTIDTLNKLDSIDSAILIVAVMLHDIGMKATIELFQNMLNGSYDYDQPGMPKDKNIYNDRSWSDLWEDYVKESQYWNADKIINIIGKTIYTADRNDLRHKILEDPNKLNGDDKRFIGEFIRRHHGRLAYEIAIRGYWGYNENCLVLNDVLDEGFLQLAGMIARSHSIGLRENLRFLMKFDDESYPYKSLSDIDIILHMVLIRLSDYLHIDKDRTKEIVLFLRKTYSPYSLREHQKHLSISNIRFKEEEETISITVKSKIENAELFVSIEQLIRDIQSEFDTCWAVLGEQYSDKYKLKYRRITSNLTHDGKLSVRNIQKYVPKLFKFRYNYNLFELLISPLYGSNPSYGVRELVQNAVDACRTRMALDKEYNAQENFTHVTVSLDPDTKLFRIVDTGIGMNIEEIEKYFLTIGSSYNSSTDWQKIRDDVNKNMKNIYRTGRFGIGILAAFLLGPVIKVNTRRLNSEQGYQFTLRLDKDFIQIDKVDLPNCGTSIEIECDDKALENLLLYDPTVEFDLGNDKWYGWYVDHKPKVEYRYQGYLIKTNSKRLNRYKLMQVNSSSGSIYWNPIVPFINEYLSGGSPLLFCNGFFITEYSQKINFSLSGLEKYISSRIPNLKITDTMNELPLNLTRSNIDPKVTYRFEKDLAVAMCKDFLCQLHAINELLPIYKSYLFFHQSGYSINRHSLNNTKFGKLADYPEAYLQGKFLVHIYYDRRKGYDCFKFDSWKQFIVTHPEAVFSFNNDQHSDLQSMEPLYALRAYVSNSANELLELKHCSIVAPSFDWKLTQNFFWGEDMNEQSFKVGNILRGDNTLVWHDSLNTELVKDLSSHIDSLQYKERPWFFIIYHIDREKIVSPLDNFINEYAGGDMLVPYEEAERRKKFSKLYAECADEIERYRIYYQESHHYKIVSNKFGEKSIKEDDSQI